SASAGVPRDKPNRVRAMKVGRKGSLDEGFETSTKTSIRSDRPSGLESIDLLEAHAREPWHQHSCVRRRKQERGRQVMRTACAQCRRETTPISVCVCGCVCVFICTESEAMKQANKQSKRAMIESQGGGKSSVYKARKVA